MEIRKLVGSIPGSGIYTVIFLPGQVSEVTEHTRTYTRSRERALRYMHARARAHKHTHTHTHTHSHDVKHCVSNHRFVGPATTVRVHCSTDPRRSVEVRTAGDAVAELGRALACLVLTSHQCDIMHRSPHRVMLTGPPGTGMKPCSSFLEFLKMFYVSRVGLAVRC